MDNPIRFFFNNSLSIGNDKNNPVSGFHTLTILLIITIAGVALSLEGPWRFLVLGLLLTGYLILFTLGVFKLKLNFFVKAHCRGNPMEKWVSITFDDGPDPEAISELLKVLKRHEIKATFFPVGKKIKESPDLLYVLGWPMVGLFSILSGYYRAPVLLIAGPVCYGISHLVFLLGMVLAGRNWIKYADIMLSWGLCRIVAKNGNREI